MGSNVVTATILSEGQEVGAAFATLLIDISKEINRMPVAQITFADGNIAKRKFEASQADEFAPGKTIEIKFRIEGDPASSVTLFKGLVVAHSVEAGDGYSHLTVELQDAACKLTAARKNMVYRDLKDSDIISNLLDANGLQAGQIEDTGLSHPEMLQYGSSDWDFMLLRAEANGLLVRVNDGEVSLIKPKIAGTAKHEFEYGMSPLLALEMRADASRQFGEVKAGAWSLADQELSEPEAATAFNLAQGNLKPGDLADKIGAAEVLLGSPGWRQQQEMKKWADGRMLRSRLSLFRGWLAMIGRGDIEVMDTIGIKGISSKFNGRTIVTGVRHQLSTGGWRTEVQFGLPEEPYAQTHPDVQRLPANGLLPAVRDLHIGLVEAFEEDPEGQFRVKVRIPTLQADDELMWARQLRPDAGTERGIYFFPEAGDEVVLGFLDGDPREPVILGSLHSSAQALPPDAGTPDENNYIKGIFTKEGIQIRFDDENKTLTLLTPEKQEIVVNGKDKFIKIKDANDNMITMDDKGITLKSAGDIKIEADGKVEIKGSEVDVK